MLRTLAILMMVFYHLIFDLSFFHDVSIDPGSPGWRTFARGTASLFLILVGVSAAVRFERLKSPKELWKRTLRRSAIVLACAFFITATTYIWIPAMYIRFGILHCIGVTLLVLPLFMRLKAWNIVLGAFVVFIGTALNGLESTSPWLMPLGVLPPTFATLDYYPLFPWSGLVFGGLGMGFLIYGNGSFSSDRPLFVARYGRILSILLWPGRHSLLVYMVHQPILLGILALIFR